MTTQEEVIQRDYSKYFTRPETAEWMVALLDPKDGDAILEPSAGNGSLVKALKKYCPKCIVFAFEINKRYEQELRDAGANIVVIKDFLETPDLAKFSSCISNPPFGNGTDIKAHFDKMYSLIKVGGKLISILPNDFEVPYYHNSYKLENWGTNKDGTVTPIKLIILKKLIHD